MMNIVLYDSRDHVRAISLYLEFNRCQHQRIDLWDVDSSRLTINAELIASSDTLLILDMHAFIEVITCEQSRLELELFLKNNLVWAWFDADGFVNLNRDRVRKVLDQLNLSIPMQGISLFLDAMPSRMHWINCLDKFCIRVFPVTMFMREVCRIRNSTVDKINARFDFLITTIQKPGRPHRRQLRDDLLQRPDLLSHGLVIHNRPTDTRAGDQPNHHWGDGFPSMDLYQLCWTEIVPETLYRDGYFFTEKTNKPISTKTPFFVVSTAGYLNYLRSQGFQTFNSLIDERYDLEHRMQDRIRLMLDQLDDVVKNGAESFYHAAKSILDHNHQRLAEIAGGWQYQMDTFIYQCLDEIKAFDH